MRHTCLLLHIWMDFFFFGREENEMNFCWEMTTHCWYVHTYMYWSQFLFFMKWREWNEFLLRYDAYIHVCWYIHTYVYMDGSKFLFCSSEWNEIDFAERWHIRTRLLVPYMDGSNFLFSGREGNGFCWKENWNPNFFSYVKISKFNEKNRGNVFHSLLQFFKST